MSPVEQAMLEIFDSGNPRLTPFRSGYNMVSCMRTRI